MSEFILEFLFLFVLNEVKWLMVQNTKSICYLFDKSYNLFI
jgi:hypothetical protein